MKTPLMHECAAPGCAKTIRTTLLMCPHHWFKVPTAFRHQVLDAWAKYQQGTLTLEELRQVQARAIGSVTPRGDTTPTLFDTIKEGGSNATS